MELHGFKRCIAELQNHGIEINQIVTDRHVQNAYFNIRILICEFFGRGFGERKKFKKYGNEL